MTRWVILTGEYPPQSGGVADYSRLVALGLVGAGDMVTVYAPSISGTDSVDEGVSLHRLPDSFGPRGLFVLDRKLARSRPDRILIQYVPHAYGYKAMNLFFAVWVALRAVRIAPVWVMFHEVMFPIQKGALLRHNMIGYASREMARLLARSAERIFVAIPHWSELLQKINPRACRGEWSPVPSNVPDNADPQSVHRIRAQIAPAPGSFVIGHFGSFGSMNDSLLREPLLKLLRKSDNRVVLLVGRNGMAFRNHLTKDFPDVDGRVIATGELKASEVSSHLLACDILIQPYPDGVSCRRGSAMAGIALGAPMVTNRGFLSEPIWGTESTGITVVSSPEPNLLVEAAEKLLSLSADERHSLGRSAAAWYRSHCAIELTIAKLRTVPN